MTPLVKQAVERAVSAMVVSGLSTQPVEQTKENDATDTQVNNAIVDEENPNIITTAKELELFERVKQIIQTEDNIEYKDTESYFGVLLNGKTNRWLLRFYDKKSSFITLPISLSEVQLNEIRRARLDTDGKRIHITNPEDILRISGLILDSYEYVKNDDNFRRGSRVSSLEEVE
ncbi:Uncharacterized conserved protein [Escherichia coli]|nr:hypothetical protein [Escherichia coli]GDO61567.1 hypothetical protein BvCmsNSNP029_02294 [Escherichia coli]STL39349.1 Uncharacterized conserved protein [Escherichia coli]